MMIPLKTQWIFLAGTHKNQPFSGAALEIWSPMMVVNGCCLMTSRHPQGRRVKNGNG